MNSNSQPTVLITRQEIDTAVRRLAGEIEQDYRDKNPLILGILKGSFIFMADLVRNLDFPLELDFVRLSSYFDGTASSGKITVHHQPISKLKGRHVLVIEDIVDTGLTTSFLLDYLEGEKPASVRLCALLDKPERREVPVAIDYLGLTVPDKFVVGYGLDCDEKYRNLPDICVLEDTV